MPTDALIAAAPKSQQQTIDEFNAQLTSAYKAAGIQRTPSSELDQKGFLQVLVSQMMNQDPTAPMSNQDFASQITSYSSLDTTRKIQNDMSMMFSSSLIGKDVEVKASLSNETVTGTVSEIVLKDGAPNVIVAGKAYPLSQIQNIKATPVTVPAPNTPQLH
jgi:flagellar basal-body rod modification protein FlgD